MKCEISEAWNEFRDNINKCRVDPHFHYAIETKITKLSLRGVQVCQE